MAGTMLQAYGAVLEKAYRADTWRLDDAAEPAPAAATKTVHHRVIGGSFARDDQPLSIGRTRILAFEPTAFHLRGR